MGWGPITESHALWWVSAALALGIAELVVPGVFLVFLAIAAAAVAIMALVLPDLGLTGEIGRFCRVGARWRCSSDGAGTANIRSQPTILT